MKVSKIIIKNFRILENVEIDLEENLSLIIGKNNCGKTSILTCLNKFLSSQSSLFTYDDLNLNLQNNLKKSLMSKKNWTDIKVKGIEVYIYVQYDDHDDLSNISKLMMDLDVGNHIVVLKMEYCLDNMDFAILKDDIIEAYMKYYKIEKKDVKLKGAKFGKFMNQFLHKNHMKYFKVTYRAIHYEVAKDKIDETITKIVEKRDVYKIISIKSIGARRDTLNKENDGSLSYLTSKYYEKIKGPDKNEAIQEFEKKLMSTDNSLSLIYKKIFSDIIEKVKNFGGINKDDTMLEIISSLGQQELLKDNTTVVYNASNQRLPESYNGLGYLNLISIIIQIETILSEFRRDNEDVKPVDINLFFIEEPEAHTHPQMQYIFIKNIKDLLKDGSDGSNDKNKINLQTVITTHSSHIVSESDFDDIKYLRKDKENKITSKNLKDLETKYKREDDIGIKKYKFLKQYLTLNRAEIFFADKAILFEGDTERILLPAMMKKIDQEDNDNSVLPLKAQNISLLEVGNYSNIYDQFLRFIGIKTLIITDIDSCGVSNSSLPVNEGHATSNGSLKHYFSSYLKNNNKKELEILKQMSVNQKILNFNNVEWITDNKGKLMITYQTKENIEGIEYYPRSFEDAFIYCNRKFFKEKIGEMENNLKNKKKYDGKFENQKILSENVYDIANDCIYGKASFAMDILINSESDENGNDFVNWKIPNYIEEGLKWLKK